MEVGNLGNIRLDQLNSHGSYIIEQFTVLLNLGKQGPCKGEIFLKEPERPFEVPNVGDIDCSIPASVNLCQGSHPRLRKYQS